MIEAEGARLLENAIAFSSCGEYSWKLIQCPAGKAGQGSLLGASAEEAPDRPRKASAWSGNQQASLKEPYFKISLITNDGTNF
jgi:hypothetical protein